VAPFMPINRGIRERAKCERVQNVRDQERK